MVSSAGILPILTRAAKMSEIIQKTWWRLKLQVNIIDIGFQTAMKIKANFKLVIWSLNSLSTSVLNTGAVFSSQN